jgi:hypothetical protein
MIGEVVEVVIGLAAILAGVGGVVFLAYFIGVVWGERRERVAFLEDHIREQASRRATCTLGSSAHPTVARAPASVKTRSRSLTEHP